MALHCTLAASCLTKCLKQDNQPKLHPSHLCMLPLQPISLRRFTFSMHSFPYVRLTSHAKYPPRASKAVELVLGRGKDDDDDDDDDSGEPDDDSSDGSHRDRRVLMSQEERQELRRQIREVLDMNPEVQEEPDPEVRKTKMKQLIEDYSLVVDEEDPEWPQDDEGWGFSFDQFFNKITIKNVKKDDDDDDNGYDSENEIVWEDDNYIKAIRDITAVDWEDTVFKDFNPLIILVHNRYKRPKENENARNNLEKAVNVFWDSGLPSPRCVAIDACVDLDLVDALQVSGFPEILFTRAGKILHRDKVVRTAEEWSKAMAFFFYKAARPPFLSETAGQSPEKIPLLW